jgi:hypothetical protein
MKKNLPNIALGLVMFSALVLFAGANVLRAHRFGALRGPSTARTGQSLERLPQQRVIDRLASGELKLSDLPVSNLTRSLKLDRIDVSPDGADITMHLRNAYKQRIIAFQVSIGRITFKSLLYERDDGPIEPGGSRDFRNRVQPESETRGFRLDAVLLEDGTGDGDPQALREISDELAGAKLVLGALLPDLERALDPEIPLSPARVESLRAQISSYPDGDTTTPHFTRDGISGEKARLLYDVERLARSTSQSASDQEHLREVNTAKSLAVYRWVAAIPNVGHATPPRPPQGGR